MGNLLSFSGSALRWSFANGEKPTDVFSAFLFVGNKTGLKERFADLRDATGF